MVKFDAVKQRPLPAPPVMTTLPIPVEQATEQPLREVLPKPPTPTYNAVIKIRCVIHPLARKPPAQRLVLLQVRVPMPIRRVPGRRERAETIR